MSDLRTRLTIQKSEARGRRGMVATKHEAASAVGVDVLAAGGSAVDAAVAAALAVGVVEPWSSGIGGGGYAVVTGPDLAEVVAFPMRSGSGATPDRYPRDGRRNVSAFLWEGVVDDANIHGYRAMGVPGAVAGLGLLHERHGRLPWRDLVLPAVELAREGFELSWFDLMYMEGTAAAARRHPELQRNFYPNGEPPQSDHMERIRITQPELAATLEVLATDGVEAFYRGDIAAAIADACAANDGVIERADLAAYRASVSPPLTTTYRGAEVLTPGPGCAGPTTIETLNIYERAASAGMAHDDVERLHAYLWSSRLAFADRFHFMTDPERADAPWNALASKDYAATRAGQIDANAPPSIPDAGDAWAYQDPARALERQKSETSTTHLCTADADGMLVSLTNTLGGAWGSEVVPGDTGIAWNNGMFWFDPVPGRPNSVAPNRTGLNNMTPTIVRAPDGRTLAVGASGGRRITNCLTQLIAHVFDFGMGAQDAVAAPRLDASTPWVTVDPRFGDETIGNLRSRGWDVRVPIYPGRTAFASPAIILRDADGGLGAGVDVFHTASAQGL